MCAQLTFKICLPLVATKVLITILEKHKCHRTWALLTGIENSLSVQELLLPSDLQVQLFFFLFLSPAQQNLFSLEHGDPQFQLCCLGKIQQNILYFLF